MAWIKVVVLTFCWFFKCHRDWRNNFDELSKLVNNSSRNESAGDADGQLIQRSICRFRRTSISENRWAKKKW